MIEQRPLRPRAALAQDIAALMVGSSPSRLQTDYYKFTMAHVGFPLRTETFYLSCRRGGPWVVPFDFADTARSILRRCLSSASSATSSMGIWPPTLAMDEALARHGRVELWAPPPGSVVLPREPLLTVTGPSFVASWLEPFAIALHFPLQVATAMTHGVREFECTCADEVDIVQLVAEALGIGRVHAVATPVRYSTAVSACLRAVLDALGGDADRVVEGGLRSATCAAMHEVVLDCCLDAGVLRTSNARAAELHASLIPTGTTGHEHQQRWGSDLAGFRAVRDMQPGPPVYLVDTNDPMTGGIEAASQAAREREVPAWAMRFDSGDQRAQLAYAEARVRAAELAIPPAYIFSDGYNAGRVAAMERYAAALGIAAERRRYLLGGHIVCAAPWIAYGRDRVQANYKLSQSGAKPVMKRAAASGVDVGKSSVPGVPRILRPTAGRLGMIAQRGEIVIEPAYVPIDPADPAQFVPPEWSDLSPTTQDLIRNGL